MECRILAEVYERTIKHATAASAYPYRRVVNAGKRLTITGVHDDYDCCQLAWDDPTVATVDSPPRVSRSCPWWDCPIGALLTWTAACRFAPSIAELPCVNWADGRRLRWPLPMTEVHGPWCVACGKASYDPELNPAYPTKQGEQIDRIRCLCGAVGCYSSVTGFVYAAHAWWAMTVGDGRLPTDITRLIGRQLAELVLPKNAWRALGERRSNPRVNATRPN